MSRRPADAPLTTADYQLLARFRFALRTFLRFSEQSARNAGLTPAGEPLILAVLPRLLAAVAEARLSPVTLTAAGQ